MIYEGSCESEDCSNDAEHSALHHRNKLTIYKVFGPEILDFKKKINILRNIYWSNKTVTTSPSLPYIIQTDYYVMLVKNPLV